MFSIKMFSWQTDSKRKVEGGDSEDLTSGLVFIPGQIHGLEQAQGLLIPLSPWRGLGSCRCATSHRQMKINVCTDAGCLQH